MKTAANLHEKILFLEDQINDKNKKIEERNKSIEEKNKIIEGKNQYILQLEALIKQQHQKRFAPASEKSPQLELNLFDEAEAIEEAQKKDENNDNDDQNTIVVPSHQRRQKNRVSIPADLPREEIIYDLNESEKICPHDGTALQLIGSEDHEQLDIIPAQIKVIRHKRLKYACPCCKGHVATAKKDPQPIEKSIASPGLLAFVATQKYCDALPLYRQSQIFDRIGIHLDRTNLANWMIKSGQLIQPLINLLHDQLLEQPVVHMDETRLQVLNEPGKTPQSHSYLWLMASFGKQPITLYHYQPTRSQTVPHQLLSPSIKALMVDGYSGYQLACQQHNIQRLGCWAHARRKFVEAQKLQPKGKTGKPNQALAFIQKLYLIEKKTKADPPDKRLEIRQQQAKPIIDKLQQWLQKSLPQTPPKTALGKALQYLHNQWHCLTAYLNDGSYPMDNNLAENAIRPFVIGRKNWLFANSTAGATASANLYSLIQTAKANQLNPYEYLRHVFTALPKAQTLSDIEQCLPWKVANKIPQ